MKLKKGIMAFFSHPVKTKIPESCPTQDVNNSFLDNKEDDTTSSKVSWNAYKFDFKRFVDHLISRKKFPNPFDNPEIKTSTITPEEATELSELYDNFLIAMEKNLYNSDVFGLLDRIDVILKVKTNIIFSKEELDVFNKIKEAAHLLLPKGPKEESDVFNKIKEATHLLLPKGPKVSN